ncbi:hypothetical protein BD324DRAFT_424119 [Kockovaella imperatae]|uniref:Protein kinase domain-containing protein n=1 Tax=Kockovaella imperatae TaxID=4999 RepID=A0A1Y1UGB6_9TREE|nr:hypothetical protein BD324DRAFT_424119 [Kockovaella imperatae]ORX37068.1 hypothetical protein BD324DRAFT_424119 [Kockovaella imperatae]
MPVMTAKAPSLYKPKSKIRLRLGLTPPHPVAPTTTNKTGASAIPSAPSKTYLVTSLESPSSSTSTSNARSFDTSLSAHTSPSNVDGTTLAASQITYASSHSRPDSRDAFALEISPSTQSTHSPAAVNFDTISYTIQSPVSVSFNHLGNQSRTNLETAQHAYPTPSPSSSPVPTSRDTSIDDDQTYNPLLQPGVQIRDSTDLNHPHLAEEAAASDMVFRLTDEQLSERIHFADEIGFGNWGSVWLCRTRRKRPKGDGPLARLGLGAAAAGGGRNGGMLAAKLVHRAPDPTTAARVKALWGEMKIIRSLRHEPHPSIIQFEAFIITPSYAMVLMPCLSDLMPVSLMPARAIPYFRQLASAVGYLHERGITHNDIKPANVLLSYNDIPVLVDFGFAQKWDLRERGSFLSSISWGTPEYLDPQRAMGMPHDERASDVWSLGITMFEILVGRTPFESEEDINEDFLTPEDLVVYYELSRRGEWIGDYTRIPQDLEHLLRGMICPDPAYRMSAMQAYHHPSLQPRAAEVIITPHFVRAAASYEFTEPMPRAQDKGKETKRKAKKREAGHAREPQQPRAVTPALGESIRQHTSVPRAKAGKGLPADGHTLSPRKVVLKQSREALDVDHVKEQDPTPTRKSKPAQAQRVQELSYQKEEAHAGLRSSDSSDRNVSRESSVGNQPAGPARASTTTTKATAPAATASKSKAAPILTHHDSRRTLKSRDSDLSLATSTSTAVYTKEDAVQKTMRRLEGKKKADVSEFGAKRDVLGSISRPAPSPPRPRSLDSQLEAVTESKKDDHRRSLGIEKRLLDVLEESPVKIVSEIVAETLTKSSPAEVLPQSPARADTSQTASPAKPLTPTRPSGFRKPTPFPGDGTPTKRILSSPLRDGVKSSQVSPKTKRDISVASPPRPRMATRPTEVLADGRPFPAGTTGPIDSLPFPVLPMPVDDGRQSPMTELRERILSDDLMQQSRIRQLSGDLVAGAVPRPSEDPVINASDPHRPLSPAAPDAQALGGRLDQLALWVKDVEKMVEDARKALAEGREPPISLPFLAMPMPTADSHLNPNAAPTTNNAQEHRFGITPDKPDPLPAHLRTCSTQVEPATPPKWMTYEEAEERAKTASGQNDQPMVNIAAPGLKRGPKKERPSVSHVLKLFGTDRNDKASSGTNTPDLIASVPLKSSGHGHVLRGAPSTPALRSPQTTRQSSKPLTRKSESNLRNFRTMPQLSFAEALRPLSPDELSPRRVVYEDLLESEPGVVRQGDGWSSWSSGLTTTNRMKQPSSMVSLRERALAFLRDDKVETNASGSTRERNIVDLAQEVERRQSRGGEVKRPGTPGGQSILGLRANGGDGKRGGGIFGRFKGKFGAGKKEREEVV